MQEIASALQAEIKRQCNCNFTTLHITRETLSCASSSAAADSVTFRAQLFGTQTHSSSVLLGYLQSWIDSGDATLGVSHSTLSADPSCPLVIDSLDVPQCHQSSAGESETSRVLVIVLPTIIGFIVVAVLVSATLLTTVGIFRMWKR